MKNGNNQYGPQIPWTKEEDAFIAEHSYMDALDLALAMGRSKTGLQSRASKIGVRLGRWSTAVTPEKYLLELASREILARHSVNDVGCWVWGGYAQRNKYGRLTVRKSSRLVHRWSYAAFNEEIPIGKIVCHSCDNPSCCNPAHLWVGTFSDNTQDMIEKGRSEDRKGEKNPGAVLSEAGCLHIRESLYRKHSPRELAEKYNCSVATIRDVYARRTWRHV